MASGTMGRIADLAHGIELANGTDLNTLSVSGFYYSPGASTSATLVNCPYTASFFWLINFAFGFVHDQIIIAGATIYTRRRLTSSSWQTWYSYLGTAIN